MGTRGSTAASRRRARAASPRTPVRRSRRGRRTSVADVLLGVFLIGALTLGLLLLAPPFEGFLVARDRVAVLEQQALALEAENLRLERRLEDLDDDVTIELLARSQQGLVREGEIPFVIVPPDVDAPRILDAPKSPPAAEEDVLDRILAWIRALTG
jgi:cell division protein FtsB